MKDLRVVKIALKLDWGHFVVLNSILGFSIWYFLDAYEASKSIANLIFILPATVVVSFLYVLILPSLLDRTSSANTDRKANIPSVKTLLSSFLVAAFVVFVSSIEQIGIDIASYIFLSVALFICGERNLITLLILPPVTVIFLVVSFKSMIPYPLPTTFF